MITTIIQVKDSISPDLAKKIAALKNTRPLMRAVGQALRGAMRDHYAGLPPNQRGFPSRNFWKKEGVDAVHIASFDESQVTVAVDSVPMGHKFFGGPVSPKAKKYLTIPLNAEAYRAGSPALLNAAFSGTKKPGKKRPAPLKFVKEFPGGARFLYTRETITHKPDARAFPPREKVEPAVTATLVEKINLIMRVS